jgi:hypothetical protein
MGSGDRNGDGRTTTHHGDVHEGGVRATTAADQWARLNRQRQRLLAAVRLGQLLEVLREFGFTDADVARVMLPEVSERTVRRWRTEDAPTSNVSRRWSRLDDLRAIVGLLLADGTYDEEGIVAWIRSRQPLLGQQRPLDLLREGRFDEVLLAAEQSLSSMDVEGDDVIQPPAPTRSTGGARRTAR